MKLNDADIMAMFVITIFGCLFGIAGIIAAFAIEAGFMTLEGHMGLTAVMAVLLSIQSFWLVMLLVVRHFKNNDMVE